MFKRKYWDKAVKTARGAGITSALGHALLYDTPIQGGAGYRMKEVRANLGGDVGDIVNGHEITELEFLTAFVEARIARGVFARIEAVGRESLMELRRMLGVLRDGDDEQASLTPQPGIGDIGVRVAAQLLIDGPVRSSRARPSRTPPWPPATTAGFEL